MRIFIIICLFIGTLFAEEIETQDMDFGTYPVPWFTGPLLAPSAKVVPPGHLKLQLYLNTFVKTGEYNTHWDAKKIENFYSEQFWSEIKFGLFEGVDFQVAPRIMMQWRGNQSSFQFGDIPLTLSVQILQEKTLDDGPSLKVFVLFNLPIGKYQRLNPEKKETDLAGSGGLFPGLGLSLSKLWYLYGHHFFEIRATANYNFGLPQRVHRINYYGDGTGKVFPGDFFVFDTALEYSFSQRWAAACDFRYEHSLPTKSALETLRKKAGDVISLAPAIEYNFSKKMGLIAGVWFSIAGKNKPQFTNGMLSFGGYY